MELVICHPHILVRPVVKRGGAPHILKLLGNPAFPVITIFLIHNTAVALQRLVCADAKQTHRLSVIVLFPVKPPKLLCKVFLVHSVAVMVKRLVYRNDIGIIRSWANPLFLLFIVPRIPVHLITAERRSCRHRQTYPV